MNELIISALWNSLLPSHVGATAICLYIRDLLFFSVLIYVNRSSLKNQTFDVVLHANQHQVHNDNDDDDTLCVQEIR